MGNAFLFADNSKFDRISHSKVYLVNPDDKNKTCFLTHFQRWSNTDALQLSARNITGHRRDLDIKYTHFKSEEVIPLFAIQSIAYSASLNELISKGIEQIASDDLHGTGDLSDNFLEVLATVCIIESTHHGVGEAYTTFSGQCGSSFLRNLIENLCKTKYF